MSPSERKKLLLRLDPVVHDALARWANDELRSTNAQIEFLLRRSLGDAGRLPGGVGRMRRPGRPAREEASADDGRTVDGGRTVDAGSRNSEIEDDETVGPGDDATTEESR